MKTKIFSKEGRKFKKEPLLKNWQEAKNFSWNQELKKVGSSKFNMAAIILDENLQMGRAEKIALFWEAEDGRRQALTFRKLNQKANQFASYLKSLGCQKGDRVFFFLPRVPQIYFGFLGTLKVGAIGGTLFAAFGHQALLERLQNSGAKFLVTNKELLPRVEAVKSQLPELKHIILVEELEEKLSLLSSQFETVPMKPSDPAFMLYTSATGRTPVCGIVTPHQAIIQEKLTAQWVLDLHEDDVYWCTADPGWVTGIVYGILAPLSLGITQVVYEGRFSADKWMSILKDYKVNVWYTAPTALRMLQAEEETVKKYKFPSLRHICSVGEALTPDSIEWAGRIFNLPVHDTWWQTETGAMMITNYPSETIKAGSMGKPIPGIEAVIIDEKGNKLKEDRQGYLAFKPGWPSMMTQVFKNEKRYKSYFRNGWYYSGDQAWQDSDGYFWFVGRSDDVIKTSGERVGPFEVESTLSAHPDIAEAAVIGKPDPLRGQIIKAFVVLKDKSKASEELKEEIKIFTKKHLAGHAYPKEIEFVEKLPKNRSGKIVRRILKAKELGLPVGDTSTLENF